MTKIINSVQKAAAADALAALLPLPGDVSMPARLAMVNVGIVLYRSNTSGPVVNAISALFDGRKLSELGSHETLALLLHGVATAEMAMDLPRHRYTAGLPVGTGFGFIAALDRAKDLFAAEREARPAA